METSKMRDLTITFCIGIIWIVTAIDIWCCQWFADPSFHNMEMNPICKLILQEQGVWTLIALKVVGTWIVTETLRYLKTFYSAIIAAAMLLVLSVLTGVIPA